MADVEKRVGARGQVRWRARVRVAGMREQSRTFDKEREALRWWRRTRERMQTEQSRSDEWARRTTVAALFDAYEADWLSHSNKSARCLRQHRQRLGWWRARLGEVTLAALSPFMIARERDGLLRMKAAATVCAYLAALAAPLRVAHEEWGVLAENPMRRVKLPTVSNERVRWLSADELERLLAAARVEEARSGKPLLLIVLLAISTGARKDSELLRMRREHVMLDAGLIELPQTKNGERRCLTLAGEAKRLLEQHLAQMPASKQLLFAARGSDKPLYVDGYWRRMRARAGLKDFRFHDLRHTYASYLAMNGATEKVLAEALGHKDLKHVRRYAHLRRGHVNEQVAAMNEKMFGQLMKGSDAA